MAHPLIPKRFGFPMLGGIVKPCGGPTQGTCNQGIAGTGICACINGWTGDACQYSRNTTCTKHGDPQYATGACDCDVRYAQRLLFLPFEFSCSDVTYIV
jgi:hypothetical protein